ncbi:hypothetical protein Tco_0519609 [Tanacetum coccineum]
MSLSLAENVIVAGANNCPPMLDKTNYISWASRMMLYIKGKEHGKLLVDLVFNGPFQYKTIIEPGNETTPATVRARTYTDLTNEEKIRESVDIKDIVKLLIQGSELSLQEQEFKLYDDFDTFTSMPGETIHSYYIRFAHLINDMHMIGMTTKLLQVNTKFVNHLQPEWSIFVKDVKLAKDMHSTNFDHLHAHLRQHKAHANEVCLQKKEQSNHSRWKSRHVDSSGETDTRCTKPKRPKNLTWLKEKMLLTEALESRAYLDLEQLALLADNGDTIIPAQASQEIPSPAAFQTDDLDAFNSDCDDAPSAKAVLMANLSSYDSDVLSEVIVDRNAKVTDFEKQIHSLKLQLNATVESHKTLSTTVECLKKESKDKEDKYLDEFIDLQKKNKALDNMVYKMGQSTQTMHMLTKPQELNGGEFGDVCGGVYVRVNID